MNAWQRYMERVKVSNAKVKAGYKKDITAIKQDEKNDVAKGNKILLILGGTILSLPLFFVGIILFVMAMLLFWDAFFGL